jgi:hypothetical protein
MQLERTPLGHLRLIDDEGIAHEPVHAVRAFPVHAPDKDVALVTADGAEKAWIPTLSSLAPNERNLIEQDLQEREFLPVIERIVSVSSFVTPSIWTVETNRGSCRFSLRGEEDIRRLGKAVLLILDSYGVHYLIREPAKLDRASRRLLDRFL